MKRRTVADVVTAKVVTVTGGTHVGGQVVMLVREVMSSPAVTGRVLASRP
ncbi:hypothetical protein AB0H88_47120 [Nonomuraea sp. NPDC050680]